MFSCSSALSSLLFFCFECVYGCLRSISWSRLLGFTFSLSVSLGFCAALGLWSGRRSLGPKGVATCATTFGSVDSCTGSEHMTSNEACILIASTYPT
ncbi:hypothetical protein EDD16DRAFT_741593 [Pisolithus croceorrhizus]|nr:hypothetical protein EDD16DRAFT_741593 [Pisolithus croceorrhizus]KAI6156226.1 hypothetical protein EDD17DRAFT_1053850 [Pisolithus thermaeus]